MYLYQTYTEIFKSKHAACVCKYYFFCVNNRYSKNYQQLSYEEILFTRQNNGHVHFDGSEKKANICEKIMEKTDASVPVSVL